jgi:hypothetical protein
MAGAQAIVLCRCARLRSSYHWVACAKGHRLRRLTHGDARLASASGREAPNRSTSSKEPGPGPLFSIRLIHLRRRHHRGCALRRLAMNATKQAPTRGSEPIFVVWKPSKLTRGAMGSGIGVSAMVLIKQITT